MRVLMTGNEAIARGAYEAGLHYAAAYPGTPSTEILESLKEYKEIKAEWATNEKTAFETAIGASIAGGRAMTAMKMVGLNVAADPMFTYAYMGVNGGFVFISADDPGMFSSQNEQDNRAYAPFAKIAMLEPSDSQECYEMTKEAFTISEALNTTVMIRTTTRVNHGKSLVTIGERTEVPVKEYTRKLGATNFDAVPAKARGYRIKLEQRMEKMAAYSETTALNYEIWNGADTGIVTSGISYTYAKEVFGDTVNYLKLGFTHPLPMQKIRDFAGRNRILYVIEELDPFLENELKRNGISCIGKEILPNIGELSTAILREKILQEKPEQKAINMDLLVARPPTLCAGCPHRGFFYELGRIKNIMITSDIGCYALGGAEPLNAKDTGVCMGAGIGVGHGAQVIFDREKSKMRSVGVIGDSTFFHTGINGIMNAVYNRSDLIMVVLDNRTTAMTGHQENPGTGFTAQGEVTEMIDIEKVVRALGIEHVRTINPHHLKTVKETFEWALALDEPSVIVTRYPCALKRYSDADVEEFGRLIRRYEVREDLCIGCKKCAKTGCPAVNFRTEKKKSSINPAQCVGCSVCAQVCPVNAILPRKDV